MSEAEWDLYIKLSDCEGRNVHERLKPTTIRSSDITRTIIYNFINTKCKEILETIFEFNCVFLIKKEASIFFSIFLFSWHDPLISMDYLLFLKNMENEKKNLSNNQYNAASEIDSWYVSYK